MRSFEIAYGVCVLSLLCACGSSDPTGSAGSGLVAFTTWGEEYIEQKIPAAEGDEDGFVDGWAVSYEKFLVNFQNITVADSSGKQAARIATAKLFDNHRAGVKTIALLGDLPAQAWDRVSYEIAPAGATSELDASADAEDAKHMRDDGLSVYVEGTAVRDDVTKHFAWGFKEHTLYSNCRAEEGGREQEGIVVRSNAREDVQLTTHGDHLFYDRLQASPDPAVKTSLRFQALADSDANEDGEITLAELDGQIIDVRLYDPSGLGAATYGAFIRALVRTVGHFRGEGECTVSKPAAD